MSIGSPLFNLHINSYYYTRFQLLPIKQRGESCHIMVTAPRQFIHLQLSNQVCLIKHYQIQNYLFPSHERSQPKLTLLPLSPEQVQTKGTATLVCLANHFYPDELEVQWKKDGAVILDGVQTNNY
eukprot:g33186.t1